MRYIETLKDGERISEVYLCKSKSTATTKAGKEYENVMLMDKTGQLDSKIWDPNSGGISDFDALDYVAVTGQVTSFNGALQLKIDRIRKADEGEYIESDYIPSSRFNIDDMYKELLQFAGSIKNTYISSLLKALAVTAMIGISALSESIWRICFAASIPSMTGICISMRIPMPVLTVYNSDLQGTLMQISESVLRCEGVPRQLHSFLQ